MAQEVAGQDFGLGPVGLALVLAAVVVVVALALQGRRLGRAVPAGDAARVPTAGDLVTAVAELYRRSGRRGPVAACYAAELKERVGAATGLEPGLDDAAFCAALRPWGEEPAARVAEVLAQARVLEAGVPGEDDLVTLARAVDAVESRWTVGARR